MSASRSALTAASWPRCAAYRANFSAFGELLVATGSMSGRTRLLLTGGVSLVRHGAISFAEHFCSASFRKTGVAFLRFLRGCFDGAANNVSSPARQVHFYARIGDSFRPGRPNRATHVMKPEILRAIGHGCFPPIRLTFAPS